MTAVRRKTSARTLLAIAALFASVVIMHRAVLAEELPQEDPVGYILEVDDDDRDTETENIASVIHNGKELIALHGMPVYRSDVVTTGPESTVGVAFLDNTSITLREDTKIAVVSYEYPSRLKPTMVDLQEGRAFFDINPRPAAAHFMIKTQTGQVEVKGTKFQVYSVPDPSGGFTTSVAVTEGVVNLQPNGANAVDILDGTQVIVNVRNPKIEGFNGTPVSLTKGNLDKNTIKALKKAAFFGTEVQINKKKQVKIKSNALNGDGSTTKLQVTEIDGQRIKSTSTTKDGSKKTILKTNINRERATISRVEGSQKISEKFKGNTGKTTIRDGTTKQNFLGTIKKVRDGLWVSDASVKKDGTRLVIRRELLPDGTEILHKTIFKKGATTGVETMTTRTPDGKISIETNAVTTIPRDEGVFQRIPGTTVVGTATPPKQVAPPEQFTPADKLVPLPPPKDTSGGGGAEPPPGGGGEPPPPEPPVSR